MSDNQTARPEAITAARWWGQQLRDLAALLKPVVARGETAFVGTAEGIDAMYEVCNYQMTVELCKTLTDENITRFEELLAAGIDAVMTADSSGVCRTSQFGEYDVTDPELTQALQGAGIEMYRGVMVPVFDRSMITLVGPGDVRAAGGYTGESEAEALHSLPILES